MAKSSTQPNMTSLLLFVVVVISHAQAASLIQKRSVGQSPVSPVETCMNDSPCGWEVYHPTTRNHAYYVTSSCVCPAGEKCVMASDDLAIAAYVYTCRVLPPRRTKSRNRTVQGQGSPVTPAL